MIQFVIFSFNNLLFPLVKRQKEAIAEVKVLIGNIFGKRVRRGEIILEEAKNDLEALA